MPAELTTNYKRVNRFPYNLIFDNSRAKLLSLHLTSFPSFPRRQDSLDRLHALFSRVEFRHFRFVDIHEILAAGWKDYCNVIWPNALTGNNEL